LLAAALGLACVLGGCASNAPTIRGQVRGQDFQPAELLQSEGNRIAQNAMLANHRSLMALADKLYRRNPAEWRKRAATREAALADIERSLVSTQPWPPLGGRRDVTALSHALAPDFAGDRVAAFIVACADTIVTAHGGKREFYYLDGIDPQHPPRRPGPATAAGQRDRPGQPQPQLRARVRQDHRPPGPAGQLRHRALPPRRDRLRAGRGGGAAAGLPAGEITPP